MKFFNRIGNWLKAVDRWIFVRLVRLICFLLPIFGIRGYAFIFQTLAYLPFVRMLVVPLWRRVLFITGHRVKAAEWLSWVVQRWPYPRYLVLNATTLVDARRFVGVSELLTAAKAAITTRLKYSGLYFDIVNIEAMLAIEKGDISPDAAFFAVWRGPAISDYCYQRAWDAHSVLDANGTRRYLEYYMRMINYDPDLVFNVCDALMIPNSLWLDIMNAMQQVELRIAAEHNADMAISSAANIFGKLDTMLQLTSSRKRKQEWLSGVHLRMARAYFETGRFERVYELLSQEKRPSARKCYMEGLLHLYDQQRGNPKLGRQLLAKAYADKQTTKAERSMIAGEIAVAYEESHNFAAARQYYVSSFYIGGIPSFLPDYLYRHVSFCMAKGDYEEATHVMQSALRLLWIGFRKLARVPVEKRIERKQLIPPKGAFFLGCWGIGDDIIRFGMLAALLDVEQGAAYGFSVDPRMQTLYQRSFPRYEFVPISRQNSPFAVSEQEYFRLRDGVPPSLDRGRFDINILNAVKRYPDIALTEDAWVAFIQAGPKVCRPNVPLLKVMPEKLQAARNWLATLPSGRNVGISWRSGQRNLIRDKSYSDLVRDWGKVLAVDGVNFINFQYSWEEDELREAEKEHGCRIHMMPGVDLKNDIEDIVALAYALDLVIAPGTAVREMCAAAGARVWTLSTTPVLPDLWRLQEDGLTDRLFPSMIHFTAERYGDVAGALKEIAKRLPDLTAENKESQRALV
ncbi:MAG TPA: hypothetical protein PLF25_01975 [Accumulibacter sp.]|nr:hypothetical protein [Accumulibacter sp.]